MIPSISSKSGMSFEFWGKILRETKYVVNMWSNSTVSFFSFKCGRYLCLRNPDRHFSVLSSLLENNKLVKSCEIQVLGGFVVIFLILFLFG